MQRIAYGWNDLQQSMGGDVYDLVDFGYAWLAMAFSCRFARLYQWFAAG
ncbi:hypothetical protein JWG39_11405 [Desulforhopalus vacuolatus]|nr:hypothetical protein [Desulforhopalus vacuolatus]MBM9520419.1 hypothetical protein [Desulforhopalus vacuolatus]